MEGAYHMGSKWKIPPEVKVCAVEDYLAIRKGSTQIREELGIRLSAFQAWRRKYEMNGLDGLYPRKRNASYPSSLKLEAVKEYLGGGGSMNAMCRKYGIASHSILQQWIALYNEGHEDFKTHHAREGNPMAKGKKTSYKEKVQAVLFCIENNGDYQMTCDQFGVSYHQIYSWVQKCKEQGEAGLVDRRGKHKTPDGHGESEKTASQMRRLEAENQRLRMENDFLKNLNEAGRGRSAAGFTGRTSMRQSKRYTKKKDIR